MIRDSIKTGLPKPSEFLVFNTRRPMFTDIRVRQALTLLFDFEWINRTYFFGLYARARPAIFAGSDLSAYARAADDRERDTAEALRRKYSRQYSRWQLPPAGQRWLGPRPPDAAHCAGVTEGCRLRAR